MTQEANSSIGDVSALLAERRKYEEWIAALDARKASTPPHVYERVRTDYDVRLQAVIQKLSAHRGFMEKQAQVLAERLIALKAEEQACRDERAETELRSQVGELTASEFSEVIRRIDDRLAQLAAEHTKITSDLTRAREFLGAGTSAASAAPPARTPTPAPSAPRPTPSAPKPTPAPAPRLATPSAAAPRPSFDELAFLNSVVGPEEAARARQSQHPSGSNGHGGDNVKIPEEPETLAESLLARVNRPRTNDIVRQEPTDALSGARGNASETPLAGKVTAGESPIVLRPDQAQGKTLKCADCGS
ncbi:MAG TPA: hypothetical protein VFZ21_06115, partial [Gemmatimonadaceae bacterium]|nr:hypothetical protein [Gemmatimonadaceae bacterium]